MVNWRTETQIFLYWRYWFLSRRI